MIKQHIKAWNLRILLAVSMTAGGMQTEAQTAQDSLLQQDSLVNIALRKVAPKDVLGAISSVRVSDLLTKNYASESLDNLQSYVSGYTQDNVWGQAPLILIDGIPRRAEDIHLVEVESITVLKDANAVALYGSRASKGVVLITSKRGSIKPLSIDVRANTGLLVPKRYPSYLNAGEYMTLYNEALRNDGLPERFSAEQIYHTAAGTNPYRYPDLNLLSSDYLKKFSSKTDLTTEISGGNDKARYYSNIGLAYNNDLLKLGEAKKNNDFTFNIRTNVDMNLTSWLKASTDAVAIIDNNYAARGDFWGTTATMRPNHDGFYPYVPIDMLDPDNPQLATIATNSNHLIDGKYLLGGLSNMQTNELSQVIASGYIRNKQRTFMFNVGAEADLSGITEGLSFSTRYSMDYTTRYTEGYSVPYATYQPIWATIDGQEIITGLTQFGNDGTSTSEFIGTSLYNQTMSITGQFNYERSFNQVHNVSATLLGWGYITQFSSDADTNEGGSDYHPIRNTNLGIQAGYNYKQKYYADFTGAVIHSAKLPKGHRNGLSPTFTLGWRIGQEDYIKKNLSFIDDLKLTASYASLKQDIDITSSESDYYLYSGNYGNTANLGGWYQWRDGVAGGYTALSGRGANPKLTFIDQQEFRFGLDASLFKQMLSVNANYFQRDTKGLLSQGLATIYPSYYTGNGSFLPWLNYNNDKRTGFDFSVNFKHKIGTVSYNLGIVGMLYNSKATQRDEVYEYDYQYRTDRALDTQWGYVAEGLFQDAAEISNHARQTFGGEVKPGDIKYQDINEDGVIDNKDQIDLGHSGNSATPFSYGLNLTLKWKKLTFFALASGQTGAIAFKNNSYYWVRGLGKYSEAVLDRWTTETAATATYPRLTSLNNNNNFQNSTFWTYKTNRFNLNRVQITYDFAKDIFKDSSFINGMSIYANGDNLLVISKERKLMETNFGSTPQNRFFNLGVTASF